MAEKAKDLLSAVQMARSASPKRKFSQSFEIQIALKDIDPKKPEGKIVEEVVLPHYPGEPKKVIVFADGELARRAREAGAVRVLGREEISELQKDRKQVKKLAESFDFSIAQADLMILIGKALGPVLGTRGKMPKPIPPTADPAPIIERLKKSVRIATKEQLAINAKIGVESMSDEDIAANAKAVLEAVERKLGGDLSKISSVKIKTTMGKPVELEVQA
ncbi:MAG: 50S ribosomal protein L1 [Candidatus Hadarchaeum sp.]|uniref:50S ribosomal protein L1 n=1 Tax=Candidatus Hadarchaeum sp. TaxID=2883567 RepID=UPI00316FA4CD